MYHQYMTQASANIRYLSTDELKELLNDDEKLEERVNEVVSGRREDTQLAVYGSEGHADDLVDYFCVRFFFFS